MKKTFFVFASCMLMLSSAYAEKYYFVRVRDHAKEEEGRVVTASELKALQKQQILENKVWSKALANMQKKWKKDKSKKGQAFPRNCASQMKLTVSKAFTKSEGADKLLKKYNESKDPKSEKNKKKKKNEQGKKMSEKKKKRFEAKQKVLESARNAFVSELETLVSAAKEAAAAKKQK